MEEANTLPWRIFFSFEGIQHLKTLPHTPQHNGSADTRHEHIVYKALTFLHHAKMPQKYCYCAFTKTELRKTKSFRLFVLPLA